MVGHESGGGIGTYAWASESNFDLEFCVRRCNRHCRLRSQCSNSQSQADCVTLRSVAISKCYSHGVTVQTIR